MNTFYYKVVGCDSNGDRFISYCFSQRVLDIFEVADFLKGRFSDRFSIVSISRCFRCPSNVLHRDIFYFR